MLVPIIFTVLYGSFRQNRPVMLQPAHLPAHSAPTLACPNHPVWTTLSRRWRHTTQAASRRSCSPTALCARCCLTVGSCPSVLRT